jgi:phenylacetate-CoA ligase
MWTFESILKINGYPLDRAKQHLKEIKKIPVSQIDAYQNEKKWDIVKEHFEFNPFYKKLCNNELPSEWKNVPITRKKHFQTELKIV